MAFSRAELPGLLKPRPRWAGFDDFTYGFRIVRVDWALRDLHTCWDQRKTFVGEAAARLAIAAAGNLDDKTSKVLVLKPAGPPRIL